MHAGDQIRQIHVLVMLYTFTFEAHVPFVLIKCGGFLLVFPDVFLHFEICEIELRVGGKKGGRIT